MDLGAYAQIDDLNNVMTVNGISVPRLRGLRLMKDQKLASEEDIQNIIYRQWMWLCEQACCSDFTFDAGWSEYSARTRRLEKKYLIKDKDNNTVGIKWNKIHGKKRKLFKYCKKQAEKRVRNTFNTFNKYCGREDVLYIHARIGGLNWYPYGGKNIAKQPWFIEKVDDYFDETYCDIYAKVDIPH